MANIEIRLTESTDAACFEVSYPNSITCSSALTYISLSASNFITFNVTNLGTLNWGLDQPFAVFPIPESKEEDTIIIKAEGNRLDARVSWVIAEEKTTVVNGAGWISNSGTGTGPDIKSVAEQLDFLLNTFQNRSLSYKYEIRADNIKKSVLLLKTTLIKTSATPVTYEATLEFVTGTVATTANE